MKLLLSLMVLALSLFSTTAEAIEWETDANLRERYQAFKNKYTSTTSSDFAELDSRLKFDIKGRINDNLTLKFQPQVVYIYKDTSGAPSSRFKQADLYEAYLGYDREGFGLKFGRQRLVYGNQRLLGHLGWKDVSRTFDGLLGYYKKDKVKLDIFAVHPADIGSMETPVAGTNGGESLVMWKNRTLVGLYGTYNFNDSVSADLYYINWAHNEEATVAPNRSVNTYGTRIFGKKNNIDATAEFIFQGGTWATGVDQKASAMALKAGYTLDQWKTRLGIGYESGSGDDKGDPATHKDFVFPYHTNHAHYGEFDLFSLGNMSDLSFSIKTKPNDNLTLSAAYHIFKFAEKTGDWLDVVGTTVISAANPFYSFDDAGKEVDLKVVHKCDHIDGLTVALNYSLFKPGDGVKQRKGTDEKASLGYLSATYAF